MPAGLDSRRVFVAGASGAIGRCLCRLLLQDGWTVIGATRSAEKAEALRALGVQPVIVDVLDEAALHRQLAQAAASFVVHQLTDLSGISEPGQLNAVLERNAYLRVHGTRNLVAAAAAAGVQRMVAQSVAFAYAPGPLPYSEEAALNVQDEARGLTARAVASLEQQVLSAPFEGIVLRYGRFYGPGTGAAEPPHGGPVHVHAAADAARRALMQGEAGIHNIAEEDGTVSSAKAISALGWDPAFRMKED